MGKIICDVCGTSYSDAASQCPICGCARPADAQSVPGDNEQVPMESQYQYVKGGRFSKSNVRKRNNQSQAKSAAPAVNKKKAKKKNSSNKGLVITILILLLAIIAVLVYIALTFFVPEIKQDAEPSESIQVTEETPTVPKDVPCSEITVEEDQLVLSELGATVQLSPVAAPSDTTDVFAFTSSDPAVVTVDAESGLVTAVGYGDAQIEISCGSITKVCMVTVEEPVLEFSLSRDSVTLTQAGETCLIYEGQIPVSEITWHTDDNTVAAVSDGVVVAVGGGTTTVYGEYNGVLKECSVSCDFGETEETEATEETVAADNGPYQLKNPIGYSSTDVTIRIGEKFSLILVDKDGNKVTSGVTWSVEDGTCCKVTDGEVEGVSSGKAKVVATFGGESYTCIVRVS